MNEQFIKDNSLITEIIEERLEASDFSKLLPEGSFDLIISLGTQTLNYQEMASLLKNLYSDNALIETEASRAVILSALKKEEAVDLLKYLGKSFLPDNPFQEIKKLQEKISKKELNKLCHFFGLKPSIAKKQEEISQFEPITEIEPVHGLYSYQRQALIRVEEFFRNEGSALLHMPTGSGKTRTAMAEACLHLRRNEKGMVVWLADTYELCEQAAKEFISSWSHQGDRPVKCYCVFDGMKPSFTDLTSGFIVMSLQQATTFLRAEDKGESAVLSMLARYSPLVIFDEAHKATAPQYKRVLERLMPFNRNSILLGLSATPGRSTFDSSENKKLVNLFLNKVTLTVEGYDSPIDYLVHEGYLAKPFFRSVRSEFDFSMFGDPNDLTQSTLKFIEKKIADDKERTLLILQEVFDLIEKGHKRILLFAASVEQAYRLAFVINFFGKQKEGAFGAKAISSNSVDRKEAITWYLKDDIEEPQPRVLCNYGILTTGFDSPRTSAVLIGRPTTSLVLYSQMVGRGLRGVRAKGTETAEIVTIVDQNIPAFRDVGESFKHWDEDWKTS